MKKNPNILIPPKWRQGAKKILVIENDLDLVYILEQLFYQEGYDYIMCNDVTDIRPLILEYQPDLVLLDYILPSVNGGELCSQLKNKTETATLPVIIYSAAPRAFLSLGNYGCDLFIPKPFDIDDLVKNIYVLMNKHKMA